VRPSGSRGVGDDKGNKKKNTKEARGGRDDAVLPKAPFGEKSESENPSKQMTENQKKKAGTKRSSRIGNWKKNKDPKSAGFGGGRRESTHSDPKKKGEKTNLTLIRTVQKTR